MLCNISSRSQSAWAQKIFKVGISIVCPGPLFIIFQKAKANKTIWTAPYPRIDGAPPAPEAVDIEEEEAAEDVGVDVVAGVGELREI